jgi:hypothetical protein
MLELPRIAHPLDEQIRVADLARQLPDADRLSFERSAGPPFEEASRHRMA